MKTLELTLQRKTDSGYPVVAALTRPGGFLPLRREGTLNLDPAALSDLQYDPLAYGTALGQALFVDDIRDTFREGLAGGEPLRVLLSVEAPDLRTIDWHRLAAPFDGRWRCLASQQNTPFSLSIPSPASAHFPALGRRDLRALVLVAGPESLSGDYKLAPFDVPATIASIQAALGDIPCDILENPSLDALCAALTATPYTILHIVCHGAVKENGETILYFPKDENRRPTPATDLLNRLGSLARLPHFAFISACESALPQNGLGSLAGRLVRELGLPAVLAMTDRVSIATAGAIAAPFYAHLYQHGQPDLALAQSLAGLQGAHDLTVPAIFSRLGDRPLFDDNSERALTEKELGFGLAKLAEALPERAPVMDGLRDSLTRRLRSTLGALVQSLSESNRTERKETLDQLNSLSLEALDLSFNALCLGQTPPAYDSRSPFRGLESFRPEDADYFFGRETLTRKLVQKLNEHNFLAVLGASGSGKSSLVMAGLIPALNLPHAIFRPGAEPLSELDKALQAGPQLLVVDQFEELFTLSAREQRSDFISRLLEQSQWLQVVITLRADFLGEVAPFKSLKDEVQNHQEIIPPMDEAELRRAMEGQAACSGLRFESDLSQQMLDDVSGEPGAMPLLQHALWTLWTRRHGRWLRAEEYRAFGGVKQAIASTAEAVFARCTEFEKERLRDIFLRLTRLDDSTDGRDTRRRVLLRDLIPADSDPAATTLLIKQLADARLVVVTGDEVEVAHEALIRHWERLRAWLNDDRDNLRLREGVSDDARRWENAHRDESLLNHRGPRLELALAMSKNPRYRLNPVEQAYLDGCTKARDKAELFKRQLTVSLAIVALIMMAIAIFAGWQWRRSEQQSRALLARQLTAQGSLILEKDSKGAILKTLLGLESLSIIPSMDGNQLVQEGLRFLPKPVSIINLDRFPNTFIFSPTGQFVATYSQESSIIKIWDVKNSTLISNMNTDGIINAVEFSSDEQLLISGGGDGIYVWEVPTGKQVNHLVSDLYITSISVSPNQIDIAFGTDSGVFNVVKMSDGTNISQLQEGHDNQISFIHFTPDGQKVVFTSAGIVHIWDVLKKAEMSNKNFNYMITSVAISPDGTLIAAADSTKIYGLLNGGFGGMDKTDAPIKLCVWELETGIDRVCKSDDSGFTSLSFTPDSKAVIAGNLEGSISEWEISTGAELLHLQHDAAVFSLSVSGDGSRLVSISEDKTLRLWDLFDGRELIRKKIEGDYVSIFAAAISPNNRWLAVSSQISSDTDNNPVTTIQVLEAKDIFEVSHFTHEKYIKKVSFNSYGNLIGSGEVSEIFNPNRRFLISNVLDNPIASLYIWKPATGEKILEVKHQYDVFDFIFTLNNESVISGGEDGILQTNDIRTKKNTLFTQYTPPITSVELSPDGNLLAIINRGILTVLNLLDGSEILRGDQKDDMAIFSPDSNFVVATGENGIIIWDIKKAKEIKTLNAGWVSSIALSPDGRLLAVGGGEGIVKVFDFNSGKQVYSTSYEDCVSILLFSKDNKYLIAGDSGYLIGSDWGYYKGTYEHHSLKIIDIERQRETIDLQINSDIRSADISPDGRYVVIGNSDGTVRVWEIATGLEVARMKHSDVVLSVVFSPDGKWIASAGADKTARVWIWQTDDIEKEACSRVTRNLTRAEWQQYIGDVLPYQAVCPNLPLEPEPTATPTP